MLCVGEFGRLAAWPKKAQQEVGEAAAQGLQEQLPLSCPHWPGVGLQPNCVPLLAPSASLPKPWPTQVVLPQAAFHFPSPFFCVAALPSLHFSFYGKIVGI